ncbi:RGXT1-like protein [Mya arenaria]|uniref:RGXT1-like protein n=1 Tax=Mya arenaria TaxID=6604 RepID=A0ABY7DVC9_MYAAR|nr:RGXT1-like protein [Mya arenaria]
MRVRQMIFVTVSVLAMCTLFMYLLREEEPTYTSKKLVQGIIDRSNQVGNNLTLARDKLDDMVVNENDIVSVAKRVSKHNGTVLVTMINDAYLSFTYSWLCNTKDMDIHKSVLIITTDESSKTKLTRDWPDVTVFSMDMTGSKGDQTYSHAGYVRIMVKRTEMLLAILMADLEIFVFEVDCLWLANPTPLLQQEKSYDILANPVEGVVKTYAGGFLYLFTTDKAKRLWKRVTEMMVSLGEKLDKMKEDTYISEADNDQQWEMVWEVTRRTEQITSPSHQQQLGNQKKIERAKEWKHWFIREDWSCDMDLVRKTVYH